MLVAWQISLPGAAQVWHVQFSATQPGVMFQATHALWRCLLRMCLFGQRAEAHGCVQGSGDWQAG